MPPSPATPWRPERLAISIALIVLTIATPALGRPRVFISTPPPSARDLAALLRGELAALDLEVILESADDTLGPVDAVLEMSEAPRAVTVWLAKELRLSTYAADPRAVAGRDEALARQVAEVLRAELLLARPPPRDEPVEATRAAPPREVEPIEWPRHAPELPSATALGLLAVAPTLTLSPGPLPTLAQLGLDLRLFVWRGLRVQALGVLPLGEANIRDPRGTIRASTTLVGAGLGYDLAGGPLHVTPGIGGAWQLIRTSARTAPPWVSRDDAVHLAYVFASLDAGYAAAPWLWLVAGARAGVVAPNARVVVAGESLGTYGRPAIQLFAGLAVPLGPHRWHRMGEP